MDTQTQPGSPHSRTLGAFLRQGAVAIVVCVILGAVAGLALTKLMHKKYTATASVLVTATGVDDSTQSANGRTSGVINLDTEAQLVKSSSVANRAQRIEPLVPRLIRRALVKDVNVTVPANTTVLNISFVAGTPRVAQASANAFANAYLADRESTANKSLTKQIQNSEKSVASLTSELKRLAARESNLPKHSNQRIFDEAQRSLLTSQISTINQRLISLRSTQVTPGRILSEAPLPRAPSSPSRILNVASGLAIGLVIGLLVAWLQVTHRRRVRRPADLQQRVDLPVVAELQATGGAPTPLHSSEGEAYRRLAILVQAAIQRGGIVVISATGSSRSDNTVAVNLSATLAAGETSIALLRVAGESGSAEVSDLEHVSCITVDRAEDVRKQFAGTSTQESLRRLRGDNDVLVVDAPCPTQTADAQTLAVLADAVLMVVDVGTRMSEVRASVDAFDAVGAPMLGIALMRTSKRRSARGRQEQSNRRRIRVEDDSEVSKTDTDHSPTDHTSSTTSDGADPIGRRQTGR